MAGKSDNGGAASISSDKGSLEGVDGQAELGKKRIPVDRELAAVEVVGGSCRGAAEGSGVGDEYSELGSGLDDPKPTSMGSDGRPAEVHFRIIEEAMALVEGNAVTWGWQGASAGGDWGPGTARGRGPGTGASTRELGMVGPSFGSQKPQEGTLRPGQRASSVAQSTARDGPSR